MSNVPSFGKTFVCIDDKNNKDIYKKSKIKIFLHMVSINIQISKLKIVHS